MQTEDDEMCDKKFALMSAQLCATKVRYWSTRGREVQRLATQHATTPAQLSRTPLSYKYPPPFLFAQRSPALHEVSADDQSRELGSGYMNLESIWTRDGTSQHGHFQMMQNAFHLILIRCQMMHLLKFHCGQQTR
jgi:hypothetical protein